MGLRQGHLWTVAGARAVAFVYTSAKGLGLGELLALRPGMDPQGEPLPVEAVPPAHEDDASAGSPAATETEGAVVTDDAEGADETADDAAVEKPAGAAIRRAGPV